jgi:transcription initiation factor TFIIIB Brf1 subunit/transcription initiation factor TFIIB
MKCTECSETDFYLDDSVGETTCSNCGYVQVTNIFEERQSNFLFQDGGVYTRTDGGLGSFISPTPTGTNASANKLKHSLLRTQRTFRDKTNLSMNRGLIECNMVLSYYSPKGGLSDLKQSVEYYYKKLYFDHKFIGTPLVLRACAIVVLCLRERGIPITIVEVAERNNQSPHVISKLARQYARHLGKSHILQNMPINSWVDKICFELESTMEFTSDSKSVVIYINELVTNLDIHFSRSYMASAIWMTSLLRKVGKAEHTQQEICDACKCSAVAQRLSTNKTFEMLGINKKGLLALDVEGFVAGIR